MTQASILRTFCNSLVSCSQGLKMRSNMLGCLIFLHDILTCYSAWYIYFLSLTFVTIFLEFWKYFVIIFVHFSRAGRVGRRGTTKLKIAARKNHSKNVIFKFVFCWMTLTIASIFKTAQLSGFFSIRAENAFWQGWDTQLVPDWFLFLIWFLKRLF